MKLPDNVDAQAISHCGTEEIVSLAQPEPNLIQNKFNAIIVQKDSKETTPVTLVFQDFETDRFIDLFVKKTYL